MSGRCFLPPSTKQLREKSASFSNTHVLPPQTLNPKNSFQPQLLAFILCVQAYKRAITRIAHGLFRRHATTVTRRLTRHRRLPPRRSGRLRTLKAHPFRESELLFALAGDDRLRESESQDDRQRCVRDVVGAPEARSVDPVLP